MPNAKHKFIFFFIVSFCFIVPSSIFSQTVIEGFIFDKTSNESLPFATIKVISVNNYFTITNEDGMFEILDRYVSDTIEVRFLGYKTKKVPISYFSEKSKLYLTPNVNQLNEVLIVARKNKNYTYNLLNSLIQKYRNKNLVSKSKAFLSLNSSARGIPIESIEGFYNSEQSLSEGIKELKIKSGRFGQNKAFPFYSLNNTDVLKDFQLFKKTNQILPFYPGNMTLGSIKGKYLVKIDECTSCSDGDLSISFVPKKNNGKFFLGTIIFDKEALIIKKIELNIKDPKINELTSINETDVVSPRELKLNIVFNPLDFEKIQHIDFSFSMDYKSEKSFEIIYSNSFIYFYDYENSFEEPYFTNGIQFNNDYDKIIALQATDDFWNANYQFPKSYSEQRFLDFFKKYGYLINYESTIPSADLKYTKPSVILWNKNKRLTWESIKLDLESNLNESNTKKRSLGANIKADKVYHSTIGVNNIDNLNDNYKALNFSYLIDKYENASGEKQYTTRTIFDRNSSFYKSERSNKVLIYINLIFDIYEYYRQSLDTKINIEMSYDEVKKMYDETFEEASLTVKKMKNETNSGINFQNLNKWNSNLNQKLGINNYLLIMNQE